MWISNPEELHEILHLLFFGHQTLDPDFNSIKKLWIRIRSRIRNILGLPGPDPFVISTDPTCTVLPLYSRTKISRSKRVVIPMLDIRQTISPGCQVFICCPPLELLSSSYNTCFLFSRAKKKIDQKQHIRRMKVGVLL